MREWQKMRLVPGSGCSRKRSGGWTRQRNRITCPMRRPSVIGGCLVVIVKYTLWHKKVLINRRLRMCVVKWLTPLSKVLFNVAMFREAHTHIRKIYLQWLLTKRVSALALSKIRRFVRPMVKTPLQRVAWLCSHRSPEVDSPGSFKLLQLALYSL